MQSCRKPDELKPTLSGFADKTDITPFKTKYTLNESFAKGSFYKITYPSGIILTLTELTFLEPRKEVRKDRQDYLCISYAESGDYYFVEEKGTRYVNCPGVYLYRNNKRTITEIYGTREPILEVGIIMLNPYFEDFLKQRFQDYQVILKRALQSYGHNYNTPEICLIFKQIKRSILGGIESRIYYESKVLEIFSLIFDGIGLARELHPQPEFRITRADKNALKKAASLIESNLSEPPSLEQLAKYANMSATKLKASFKSVFGTTVYGYVRDLRMKHALSRLGSGDESIGEIARHVGYKSASKFSEAFKTTYGMTPTEFKNSL